MIIFINQLQGVKDLQALHREKTQIKDSIVNPQLNWNARMELYQKVQLINHRITELVSLES